MSVSQKTDPYGENQVYHLNSTSSYPYLNSEMYNMFSSIDFTLLAPIFYFHYLLKRMVGREKDKKGHALVKNLLQFYSRIVPYVFALCVVYVHIILRFLITPSKVLGDWFCYAYELYAHSGSLYIGGFSLFTALTKYWFIVNNVQAIGVGEENAKHIFTVSYSVTPLIMAAMNSMSNGKQDQMLWVNLCWMNLGEYNELTKKSDFDLFCIDKEYDITSYVGVEGNKYLTPIMRGTCGVVRILYLSFFSNILELAIYFMIFRYLNR